ncbi:hypothetical protein G4V62_14660 [Bacillaceae bacterium SIJ1]|uniref:hypothetical protein n=1 Tax=Litoribacterium kuwaitense TaxID=1398745 RepID=UPI0013EA2312|nr:hypothetical protein [Litoribacterium kuwaitense]NGP46130.1 hypothetical protein [Litoribacterium kuwaitense]
MKLIALEKKSFGLGSISLVIVVFAALFNHLSFNRGVILGEYLLKPIGLSNYYAYAGVLLFLLAWFIGKRYKKDLFARAGFILSQVFIWMYIVIFVLGIVLNTIQVFF